MQNLDFSAKLRRGTPFVLPDEPAASELRRGPAVPDDIRRRNRVFVGVMAIVIAAFTLGLMAGLQLGKVRQIESELVRYPDREPGSREPAPAADVARPRSTSPADSTSMSNTSEPAARQAEPVVGAPTDEGRFLVRVGVFSPRAAELLTNRLNHLPELSGHKSVACKDVKAGGNRSRLAFRVRRDDGTDRQNVWLGCFASKERAQLALEAAAGSGIPGLSEARLYEIE